MCTFSGTEQKREIVVCFVRSHNFINNILSNKEKNTKLECRRTGLAINQVNSKSKNSSTMKIDTKKCSPVSLRNSSVSAVPGVGLDDRELVLRNPNKYVSDDEDEDDKDDNDKYGRKVELIPRLIFTPVKVSARTNKRNSNGSATNRTVTDQEMNDLNACLLNLRFGDENQDVNATPKDSDKPNSDGKKSRMGRVQHQQVDPKTGKRMTVLRSSRIGKKTIRL